MTIDNAVHPAATPSHRLQRWMDFLGIPIALAVFCTLIAMPTPAGLSVQGQKALAIFMMALVLWVTQSIPTYATALIAMVLLVLTGTWDQGNVLGVFGQDVIWLMVCAFVLTSAMIKAGLARRIALAIVTSFGSKSKWALLSMIVVNAILAFLVPSTTARAGLMLPIVLVLAEVYGAKPGSSKFGTSLMIQELQSNNIFTSGILTATACNVMSVGFIKQLGGQNVYYTDWLLASFPIALITMLISWILGLIFLRPESDTPQGKGLHVLRDELRNMGKLSADEWKTAIIFLITVFLWVTDRWHEGWWGFQISTAMVAILSAALCFLPGIGVLSWKETKIPWDLMIFSCGAYAAGLALESSGAAAWLLNSVFARTNIKNMSFFAAYSIVIIVAMFSHIIFTSKTVRTTIIIPGVIVLAKAMGYSPMAFALPAAFTMTWSITLPPNCKPNLIFFGTGQFTVTQQLIYGLVICAIGCALMILAGPTWFSLVGIMK